MIASLRDNVKLTVAFNPIDKVTEIDLPQVSYTATYEPAANSALLNSLGIDEIPVLMSRTPDGWIIRQGEAALLAYLNAPAGAGVRGREQQPVRPAGDPRRQRRLPGFRRLQRNLLRAVLASLNVPLFSGSGCQGLIQIPEQILRILQTDTQSHHVRRYPGPAHLLLAQLAVGGAGRMDGQALGIADIGHMAEEPQLVDEALAGLPPALDAEGENGARPLGQVFPRPFMTGMIRQSGIADPIDLFVLEEKGSHGQGIVHVTPASAG